jgi:glycosyltransferase involved in cell wall biosynthesis
MPVLHVVMPVFDEGPTLARIAGRVAGARLPAGWSLRLVMVDDGSPPEAAAAAREASAAHPGVAELIVHPRNRGKGAALMTGFDRVLASADDRDAVIVQDADLEYDPGDYAALLAPLESGAGAVFGNRWGTGAPLTGWRRLHAAANGFLTWASELATGLGVHDMECCYKLLRVPALRAVRPWLARSGSASSRRSPRRSRVRACAWPRCRCATRRADSPRARRSAGPTACAPSG